jgi:hypothetical protein
VRRNTTLIPLLKAEELTEYEQSQLPVTVPIVPALFPRPQRLSRVFALAGVSLDDSDGRAFLLRGPQGGYKSGKPSCHDRPGEEFGIRQHA